MSKNYEAFEPSSLNDEDKMPVQDNPSLEIQYATLIQIREYVLALAKSIQFDINAGISVGVGEIAYNALEDTFDIGMLNGVVGQLCQEFQYPVENSTLSIIPNGTLVMADGGTSPLDNMTVVPFDGNRANAHFILGITTHDLPPHDDEVPGAGFGKVTKNGKVRGLNTLAWGLPSVLWASPEGGGALVELEPANIDIGMPVAFVLKSGETDGVIYVRITSFDEHVAKINRVLLPWSESKPVKDAVENIHGGIYPLAIGQDLSAGFVVTPGIGKLVIVVNSALPDCEMTVTGTSVDRDTGEESVSPEVSTITIDTQTDDTSTADSNSVTKTDLVDAYITDRWFTGVVTIAATGSSIPVDVDVYQVAFEQFNDAEAIDLVSADLTYETISDAGMFVSAYLYTVIVTDDKVDIVAVAEEVRGTFVAGVPYRARRANLGVGIMDGTKDGVFVQITFGGINKFLNAQAKIWADIVR
jgi:hypothetical protein